MASNVDWHKLTEGWGDFIFGYTIVAFTLCAELYILLHGLPPTVDGILAGRILGNFDALSLGVIAWRYGSTRGSHAKNKLLAASVPSKD